ncbi:MAG: tripartite tricarboxylate transporter TctB family protein [Alphaproteobacteria bacterium]|nr:tripartite tricarboxylate transporter TctB family protein [Alphaproteobacteria bacterium]
MSDEPSTEKPEKASLGADLIIPGAACLFTLYYFSTIIDSPWTAQVSAFFVGAILLVLCVIFFVKLGVQVKRGDGELRFDNLFAPRAIVPKRLALFGLTLAYIVVIDWAGFTITTFLFLFLGMLLLSGRERKNKRLIVVLSAVLSIGGYLLFVVAFQRRFPEGPFEHAFKAIMASLAGG